MIDVENQVAEWLHASGGVWAVFGSKVCDKADKMDVEGFAKEQQVLLLLLLQVECLMVGWPQVTALLKQQAADLTTFVATTVNEAIEDKATIQDCAQLQKRIEEVTGEVSWHSTVAWLQTCHHLPPLGWNSVSQAVHWAASRALSVHKFSSGTLSAHIILHCFFRWCHSLKRKQTKWTLGSMHCGTSWSQRLTKVSAWEFESEVWLAGLVAGALKKMNTKIKAMAETSFTEQSTDAASIDSPSPGITRQLSLGVAGLFFRCLSCDTKLPRLEGQQAIQVHTQSQIRQTALTASNDRCRPLYECAFPTSSSYILTSSCGLGHRGNAASTACSSSHGSAAWVLWTQPEPQRVSTLICFDFAVPLISYCVVLWIRLVEMTNLMVCCRFLTSVKFDSRPETADSAYPPGGPPGSSEGCTTTYSLVLVLKRVRVQDEDFCWLAQMAGCTKGLFLQPQNR